MSYVDWHVGMKVVCVDAELTNGYGLQELVEGRVYTIRWIGRYNHSLFGNVLGVRLEGVTRAPISPEETEWFAIYGEAPFGLHRFRPVQTRQTDISCFTQMLNPSKVNVGEPA